MAKKAAPKNTKAPKQKTTNPKGTEMRKRLAVPLTPEELTMKAQAAANLDESLVEMELQFAEVKKTWNAKITDTYARMQANLAAYRAKKEEREVDCTMVKNFDDNRVEFWVDGVMLEHREMTNDDRQEEMFADAAKAGKTKARRASDVIRETAAKRDMNTTLADSMMPGAKPGLKIVDTTEAKTADEEPFFVPPKNDEERRADIAEVHASETGRRTKRSSVDRVDSH